MKIGARAHDFGRHSPDVLAKTVRDAGFEAVQLAMTKAIQGVERFDQVTPALLESTGEAFAASGVEISVLGCYVEPSLPDREARLEQVNRFCLGLEHAARLGVSIAATETTNFDPGEDARREGVYQHLLDSVLRMVEKAEKEDVIIGVETVADHTLNSAQLTRRLLDEVGSQKLKVVFDPVNLILPGLEERQEEIYRDFFSLVGGEIVAVHIKDIVFEQGEKVWRNIGSGIVEYQWIMPWLKDNKPLVPLLREHVHPDTASKDVSAMRQLAGR